MCRTSGIVESEHIERYIANGMPPKVIKSVKYTIRKRFEAEHGAKHRRRDIEEQEEAATLEQNQQQQQQQQQLQHAEQELTKEIATTSMATVTTTKTTEAVAVDTTPKTTIATPTTVDNSAEILKATITNTTNTTANDLSIYSPSTSSRSCSRLRSRSHSQLSLSSLSLSSLSSLSFLSSSSSSSSSSPPPSPSLQQRQLALPSSVLSCKTACKPNTKSVDETEAVEKQMQTDVLALTTLAANDCETVTISTATATGSLLLPSSMTTAFEAIAKDCAGGLHKVDAYAMESQQQKQKQHEHAQQDEHKEEAELQPTDYTKTNNTFMQNIPKLCGRYRKMQQQQQQQQRQSQQNLSQTQETQESQHLLALRKASSASSNASSSSSSTSAMEPSMDDALAVGTQLTRQFAERLGSIVGKMQRSKLYTILTSTTQPAHLIAICILSFVLLTVGPDLIESSSNGISQHSAAAAAAAAVVTDAATTKTIATAFGSEANIAGGIRGAGTSARAGTLATIAYLGAFATHFGSQIWMTFVSGLSLYFSLPRHTFGQCQQILFPKYFALNAMLSILMLIIYVKYFLSNWTLAACLQLSSLALNASIEVTVRLYLAPPMLRLMQEKYKIEGAIGSGQEVGSLVQGDLVQCPHYQRIHKHFRRIHMTIAIGNMIVLLSTCLHLYFLAAKIRIS